MLHHKTLDAFSDFLLLRQKAMKLDVIAKESFLSGFLMPTTRSFPVL